MPDREQKTSVFGLWNNQYPQSLVLSGLQELEVYLAALKEQDHFLLMDEQSIRGWAFSFIREAEKWFVIILDDAAQGRGYGTMLLNRLKQQEPRLAGWVIDRGDHLRANGRPYRNPLGFYTRNGFTVSDIRLETEKISAVKVYWEKSTQTVACDFRT